MENFLGPYHLVSDLFVLQMAAASLVWAVLEDGSHCRLEMYLWEPGEIPQCATLCVILAAEPE